MPPPSFIVNQRITLRRSTSGTDPSQKYKDVIVPPGPYWIRNYKRYEAYRHDFEHSDGYLYRICSASDLREFNVWQNSLWEAKAEEGW